MYNPEERAYLRTELLSRASRDTRISGAAITGSAAVQSEDRWSDIDLAFGVSPSAELPNVLSDWTAHMYDSCGALHHLDIHAGGWVYRVFLLRNTLQVDLAFAPTEEFRPLAPTFQLVFGEAKEAQQTPSPAVEGLIGMGWLYALHARSSLARRKFWQAEYMISGMRDQALSLACTRHGLSAYHAKGADQLPREVLNLFEGSLAGSLDGPELSRAFLSATSVLLAEIRFADMRLAENLEEAVGSLSAPA